VVGQTSPIPPPLYPDIGIVDESGGTLFGILPWNKSVDELKTTIRHYLEHRNANPKVYQWTAKPEAILAKVEKTKAMLEALHQTHRFLQRIRIDMTFMQGILEYTAQGAAMPVHSRRRSCFLNFFRFFNTDTTQVMAVFEVLELLP
jgi:hypothetical protein